METYKFIFSWNRSKPSISGTLDRAYVSSKYCTLSPRVTIEGVTASSICISIQDFIKEKCSSEINKIGVLNKQKRLIQKEIAELERFVEAKTKQELTEDYLRDVLCPEYFI